ncbi:LEA type 2 family protein [Puia sp. P3]|uniref:LEA type 2 family protein n=1 Tax=Puia sp. P3 TaxID=3423952 RepID=UPI003D66E8BA
MPRILQPMSSLNKYINKYLSATRAAAFVLLLGWATGCRQPDAPEYYGFQDPQINHNGSLTMLATTLKLYNPNPYALKLLHADVDVSLNGKAAGHSILDSTIIIPEKDTFFVPVSMQVDMRSVFSNALSMLMERQATISLDGHVKIRRGCSPSTAPFTMTANRT